MTPLVTGSRRSTHEVLGTIEVEEHATTVDASGSSCARRRPLAGIALEVHGPVAGATGFALWAQGSTDHQGRFRLRVDGKRQPRRLHLRTRFGDERLTVSESSDDGKLRSDWSVIADAPTGRDPSLDLGTLTFRRGAAGALGAEDVVRRAATWYVVRTAMMFLRGLHPALGFAEPIALVYPATVVGGSSCANGLTRTGYIHRDRMRDDWSAAMALHQVMHLWTHQHSDGAAQWLQIGCALADPDALERQPAIAFHEGFAEFATSELMAAIWGRVRPRASSGLGAGPYRPHDLAVLERDAAGVCGALHRLMSEGIAFSDILRVFLPNQSRARPTAWPVGAPDLGLAEFHRRAADIAGRGWPRNRPG